MFVETWFILLGEHGKTQPIYVIWVIQTPKVESLRHSFGLCTKVATLRWGHLRGFFRWFFHLSFLTWGATNWDLWWPASRAIYEPTHRRCHLFLESLGWLFRKTPQKMLEMLETWKRCSAKFCLFLFGMLKCYENPTETGRSDVEKSEVSEVYE